MLNKDAARRSVFRDPELRGWQVDLIVLAQSA